MKRRTFLRHATTALAAGNPVASTAPASLSKPILKAAVIGHTGRGDYGHGLEKIFQGRPGIELVALADADEAGRKRTAAAIGAPRSYSSWQEMLDKEKPDLVSIGMRHADQHRAVMVGCIQAGAHVYAEKPFTTSPAESDEVLAAAKEHRRVVAVAHTQRIGRPMQMLRQALTEGLLGDLRELRAYGKQDHRAGGEDLMVLGSHLMDLMRMLAGDPLWCSARVLQDGRDVILNDARIVKDHVGPVAGDTVFAQFAFPNSVQASFTSSQSLRETIAGWGIEIIGTKAMARLNCDLDPHVFLRSSTPWTAQKGKQDTFAPLVPEMLKNPPAGPFDAVGDWLAAIREQRIPICSAENAAWAVEMVISVYTSALTGKRAHFPLGSRIHPLRPA